MYFTRRVQIFPCKKKNRKIQVPIFSTTKNMIRLIVTFITIFVFSDNVSFTSLHNVTNFLIITDA